MNKYWPQYCWEETKKAIHKTGKFFLSPVWNYLPLLDIRDSLELAIVLTKRCNANCIFCRYQFLPPAERSDMSEEIFSDLLKAIKESGILRIHLTSNAGEPLLANNFLEKIERLRRFGVKKIRLTTNGIFLDTIGIDRILESGINSIIISTSPFNPGSYRSLYRSNEFERMKNNVITLLTQNKIKHKPCHISISINSDMPRKEVLAMPETQRLILLADHLAITEAFGDWLGLIKSSMLHGTMRIEKPIPLSKRPCTILLVHPAVYPNGDISACLCRNINNDPDMYLGNIQKNSLNAAIDNLRRIVMDWRRGKIPKTCYLCTMYSDPSYYWIEYFRKLVLTNTVSSLL